ncbi:dynein beta chain, putative [Plasmodium knowlesi strain H]|uniref:Dynein beta chain, putative n=3 Tax=Plasmodium knowlesi TaxID=5850 RepID=A0A1A7VSS8_PLAKH|nr:dynein beta chain, putative [Plasmodium knowlesi strain H]OTN65682.1 putative Dynein beta chain [Plasmodium knowlesi]CAA9989483.1 dynein beta chain, putative [Plasmodium knowlesi strain H]SBO25149.1 dynein beta chain, putative [Plasmodium knowlesi strain H]SBO27789.1 dynein beta chain, putative [Plasmodium knowlesi strain H]VVS78957.1 dynein beta chain, putative [Plasmodium knowlesi strain H]
MEEEISEEFITLWMENKISFSKYSFKSLWNKSYNKVVKKWLDNASNKILFIYLMECDEETKLKFSFDFSNEIIEETIHEYILFLKIHSQKITQDNIDTVVLYNKVNCKIKENILTLMDRVFIPMLDMKNSSPINIQNDFNITTIEFMTYITQLFSKNQLIYYPKLSVEEIHLFCADKNYIHLLENLVNHWISDIQKLFSNIYDKEISYLTLSEYISDVEKKHGILKDLLEELNIDTINYILTILEKNNCANIKTYNSLMTQIREKCEKLEEKLKALKILEEPFTNLNDDVSIDHVYNILPIIVNRLKLIFTFSKYYKDSDQINSLITLLLNEFIKKLNNYIDLSKMYTREVRQLSGTLDECINFVFYWDYLMDVSFNRSNEGNSPFDSIIRQMNLSNITYFKQKCADLKEICFACEQFLFCVKEEDIKALSYEHYHIIKKGFNDIESTFYNELNRIRNLEYNILSIRNNEWSTDFKKTKEIIKVLESIFINVIKISFENSINFETTIFLFDKYYTLAITENIKSFMNKKVVDLWTDFVKYVDTYSRYFANFLENPFNYFSYNIRYEYHSSCIMVAKNISIKLHRTFDKLNSLFYLPKVKEQEVAYEKYYDLQNSINTYIKQINNIWINELKTIASKKNNSLVNTLLDNSILIKVKEKYLESTYNMDIKKVLSEVNFWLKIKDEKIFLPNVIMEISFHEERLKMCKEYVNRLVRNYNNICMMLNSDQYKIFEYVLRNMYCNIENTIFKYNWNKDNIKLSVLFNFLNECIHIKSIIATFKRNDEKIKDILNEIEKISIISIDDKRTYTLEEFQEEQNINLEGIRSILRDKHTSIVKILKEILLYIEKYSNKSLNAFKTYIANIERNYLEKYFISVKVSLYNYYKLLTDKISNDAVENYPLFKIYVKLNSRKELVYDFSHQSAKNLTDEIYKKASDIFFSFPKFSLVIFKNRQKQVKKKLAFAFSTTNANDKDIQNDAKENELKKNDNNNQCSKLLSQINNIYVNFMEKLKEKIKWLKHYNLKLLSLNEEDLLNNLHSAEDTMTYVYNQINVFRNLEENIKQDIDKEIILFIEINLSTLKKELLADFKKYKDLFLDYISAKCKKKLEELYAFFKDNSNNLLKTAVDINDLKEQNALLDHCSRNYGIHKKELENLEEDYLKLIELKGELNEDEIMKLKTSSILSSKFEALLKESRTMYLDTKEKMKNEIKNAYNEFNKLWQKKKLVFYKEMPINIDNNPDDILHMISFYEDELKNIKQMQNGLKNKISLFNIDDVCDEQINDMEIDLNHLKSIWRMIKFWQTVFDFVKNVSIFFLHDIVNDLLALVREYKKEHLSDTLGFVQEEEASESDLDISRDGQVDKEPDELEISYSGGFQHNGQKKDEANAKKEEYGRDDQIVSQEAKNLNIKFFLNQLKTNFLDIFEQFLINMKRRNTWEIYKELKNNVGKLKFSLILVEILTNECMKYRHFKEIEMKTNVQWNLSNITLHDIIEQKLYKEIKFITILYNNAEKELFIENNLKKIINKYENMKLSIQNCKSSLLIEDAEKIFNNINEDLFLLNNIKIYNFDINFLKKTEKWEGILGNLYDNLEIVFSIQKKNEYLKSILSSSDEMRPHLNKVYEHYNLCNQRFVKMVRTFQNGYVLDKINNCNNVRTFLQIQKQLNFIEKSLESYLEKKKSSFPRFYFLSNKEILEILGIYKNPMLLKKKIQKIFSSIYSIEFVSSEKKMHFQKNNSKCSVAVHDYNKNSVSFNYKKGNHKSNSNFNKDKCQRDEFPNMYEQVMSNVDNTDNNCSSYFDIYIFSQYKEKIKLHKKMKLNYESSTIILNKLEENIFETLKLDLVNVQLELKEKNLKNWVLNNPQQLVLISKCINFTNDYEHFQIQINKGSHIFVNQMKKENHKELLFLTDLIKTIKDKKNYIKISALIILESYYKDVAEKLIKNKIECNDNFLWMCQLKYILCEDEYDESFPFQKSFLSKDVAEKGECVSAEDAAKSAYKKGNSRHDIGEDLANVKGGTHVSDGAVSTISTSERKKNKGHLQLSKPVSRKNGSIAVGKYTKREKLNECKEIGRIGNRTSVNVIGNAEEGAKDVGDVLLLEKEEEQDKGENEADEEKDEYEDEVKEEIKSGEKGESVEEGKEKEEYKAEEEDEADEADDAENDNNNDDEEADQIDGIDEAEAEMEQKEPPAEVAKTFQKGILSKKNKPAKGHPGDPPDHVAGKDILKTDNLNASDLANKNNKQFKYLRTINLMINKSMTLYLHYFNNKRKYAYEYQGNTNRLVITPLTEKCFYSCLFSLDNFFVNAIKGETGVGKSETIKDFSRMFGTNIISINCNNNNTSKYIGNILSGILQSGFWCCFDEFNRIDESVIVIVVEQFRCIKHIMQKFHFDSTCEEDQQEYMNYEDISSYHQMAKWRPTISSDKFGNHLLNTHCSEAKEVSSNHEEKRNVSQFGVRVNSKEANSIAPLNKPGGDKSSECCKSRDFSDTHKGGNTNGCGISCGKAQRSIPPDSHSTATRNEEAFFEGQNIKVKKNCSIYLTLCKNNDNCLYSLENYNSVIQEFSFKPPNFHLICQFSLISIGFKNAKKLSKKINICYSLLYEFLSKQEQYIIDLREIKKFLNLVSEDFISNNKIKSEEEIIYDAMVEVNQSKLLKDDLDIFYNFLKELFPLVKKRAEKNKSNDISVKIITDIMSNMGYTINDYYINSILKLHKIKKTNKGIVLVGKSCTGKTSIINIFKHYCEIARNANVVRGGNLNWIEDDNKDGKFLHPGGKVKEVAPYNSGGYGTTNHGEINHAIDDFAYINQINNVPSNASLNSKGTYESYNLLYPVNLFSNKYKNQGNANMMGKNNSNNSASQSTNQSIGHNSLSGSVKRLSKISSAYSMQSKNSTGALLDFAGKYKKNVHTNEYCIDITVFNPMSTDVKKLYGYYNSEKEVYEDGILSLIMKRLFENNNNLNEKWLILDGPLDILTTEPLHSLLDENKVLTLINGNRIKFADNVFIFFEIENLKNCAPSFISRSKIVYMNEEEFNYEWLIESYLQSNFSNVEEKNLVQGFFNKYIKKIMNAKRNKYNLIIDVSDANVIISICQLYDMLCNLYDKNFPKNLNPSLCLEKLFLQSIIYTFSNILCPQSKRSLDILIKSIDKNFPHMHTIFDYIISKNNFNWVLWDELITTNHNFLPNVKEKFFSYDNYNFCKNDSSMKYMSMNQLSETINPETDFNKFFMSSNLHVSKNFNKYTINYNNLFSDDHNKNTLNGYQPYHTNFLHTKTNNMNDASMLENYHMFSDYSKDNIYSNNNYLDSDLFNTYSKNNMSNNYFSDNSFSNNNFSDNLLSYRNNKREKNNFQNEQHEENYSVLNDNFIESYNKSSLKNIYNQKDNLTQNGTEKTKEKYFHQKFNDNIFIENVESLRKKNIINILMYNKKNVLLIGNKFSGKTFFMKYNILPYMKEDISSYYTFISKLCNSSKLEKKIEMNVEKKCRNIYKPLGNKKCLYFILDDLNNLQKYDSSGLDYFSDGNVNHHSSGRNALFDFNINRKCISKNNNLNGDNAQIPNESEKNGSCMNNTSVFEFLNQFIDYNMYYNKDNGSVKNVENLFFFLIYGNNRKCASTFNRKLINRLHVVHLNEMDEACMKNTFHVFLRHKFSNFHEVIKNLAEPLSSSTIKLFFDAAKYFKANLNCYHYFFHLKHIFKIMKGLYLSEAPIYEEKESVLRLWVNECFRSLGDQLILKNERRKFKSILKNILHKKFYVVYNYLFPKKKTSYFCSYNFHDTKNENPYFFYQPVSNENVLIEFFRGVVSSYNTFILCSYDRKKNEYFKSNEADVVDAGKKGTPSRSAQRPPPSRENSLYEMFQHADDYAVGSNYENAEINGFIDGETNGFLGGQGNDLVKGEPSEHPMNASLEKSQKMSQEIAALVSKNDNDFNNICTPINFILFKEAMINICKFSRILLFENEHFISIGDSGPGKFTCCLIACFIYQIKVHVIKNFHYGNGNVGNWGDEGGDGLLDGVHDVRGQNMKGAPLAVTMNNEKGKGSHVSEVNGEKGIHEASEGGETQIVVQALEGGTTGGENSHGEYIPEEGQNKKENQTNHVVNTMERNTIVVEKDEANKFHSNLISGKKGVSIIEKIKCNYFIKKFKEAIFNCYKKEKRCVLYYLDDNMSDDILEFLHEIYSNVNIINIFNSEEIAYLKNIFLQNDIGFKNFDTLSEMMEELIKTNYHYVLFTTLKSKMFRKISNEYNVILKQSTVNYFCSWKNVSYNIIAQEMLKKYNLNVDVFSKLHNMALKMFECVLHHLEEKLDREKKEKIFFLNEFSNHTNFSNYEQCKNASDKNFGMPKLDEQNRRYEKNSTLTKSKNALLEENKQSMEIKNSLKMNTKESCHMNSNQTKIIMQSKKTITEGAEENDVDGENRNEEETENNIKYIRNSKIVEDKLNIQKYINFKHFFNFLQFFEKLYKRKFEETNKQEKKINIALSKLAEARNEIQEMHIQLSLQKENISKKQTECTQLLKEIEEKKEESNEKKKKIQEDSIRISSVEIETQKLAEDARKDLQNAIPELEVATQSLEQLDKKSISEVKAYTKPPDVVMQTLSIVMIILNKTPSWEQAKIELGDANFLNKLKSFDKDSISDKTLKKIEKFTKNPIYSPKAVKKVSSATGALCMWVHALKMYAQVYREVAPKRLRLKLAEELLSKNRKELELTMEQLNQIEKNLQHLQEQHNESTKTSDELSRSYEESCQRIENVEKFFLNLMDEKNRWEKYVKDNERVRKSIYGESILSSFFLVYTGLLNYEDRKFLIYDACLNLLIRNHIFVNTNFNVVDYFIDPIQSLEFRNNFLSNDIYMKENSILINNNFLATLIVDPHYQAANWIRRSYLNNGKSIVFSDFHSSDIFFKIIHCMNTGTSLLINYINEDLEEILLLTIKKYNKFIFDRENSSISDDHQCQSANDALIREYAKRKKQLQDDFGANHKGGANNGGGGAVSAFGQVGPVNGASVANGPSGMGRMTYEEKLYRMKLQLLDGININRNFKLFLVSNKNCFSLESTFYTLTTVIVFSLNKESLDNILLNVIIMNEEKNLEEENKECLMRLIRVKKEIIKLENNILEHITKSEKKITEDDELINILLQSKSEIDEKNGQLEEVYDTINRMNMNKNMFKPLAKKVAILFTILNDLKYVNNYYQFSLEHFISFFTYFMKIFKKNNKISSSSTTERQEILFSNYFFEFLKYTKVSLANKHHLFFVFYSLCKIMILENKISQEDYEFFTFGSEATNEQVHTRYMKRLLQENSHRGKGDDHAGTHNGKKGAKRKGKNASKRVVSKSATGEDISNSNNYAEGEDDEPDDEDDENEEDDNDENDVDEIDVEEIDMDEEGQDNDEEEADDDGDDSNREGENLDGSECSETGEHAKKSARKADESGPKKDENEPEGKTNLEENKRNNNDGGKDKLKENSKTINNKRKKQNKKKKYNSNNQMPKDYQEEDHFNEYSEYDDRNSNCAESIDVKYTDMINPGNDWISDEKWRYLLHIERLKNFEGFINSFVKSIREWRRWFNFLEVENYVLPDEWEFNLNSFQKLIIIKILRPDRLNKAIENLVYANISYNDIQVDHMNFEFILRASNNMDPLTIIYKNNFDPFQYVYNYALENNQKLKNLTLTDQNIHFVYHYLRDAMEKGHILFISNLHNSVQNLHKLAKIIENVLSISSTSGLTLSTSSDEIGSDANTVGLTNTASEQREEISKLEETEKDSTEGGNHLENVQVDDGHMNRLSSSEKADSLPYNALIDEEYGSSPGGNTLGNDIQLLEGGNHGKIPVHPNFRLFLSCLPSEKFPTELLQKSIIVILEEPPNVKKSISILFKEQWELEENKNIQLNKYKKLLLSLFWFHSILNNRKKFYNLGWNSENYFFNNKDIMLSKYISQIFFNKNVKEIYWPYFHYYICDIIYGSKINDSFDKELLNIYANEFFNNNIFKGKYIFSNCSNYYLPNDVMSEKVLNNYLKEIPHNDSVEIFGQKTCAEIPFNTIASEGIISLFFHVNSLHRNQYHFHNARSNHVNEKEVYSFTKMLLQGMPHEIYVDDLMKKQCMQEQYVYTNLMCQEIYKHNLVLRKVRRSIGKVQCALKGETVINKQIYKTIRYLSDGLVPNSWKAFYISKKNLLPFFEDLNERVNQLNEWSINGALTVHWLGGFCNPRSILKYILYEYSKKNDISHDLITFEFTSINKSDEIKIKSRSIEEGIYIKKLILQGAKWDFISQTLMETDNNNLYFIIPTVYLKVVLKKKSKEDNDIYYCPLYMCQEKNVVDVRENYLMKVGLRTGSKNPSEWGKLGVRLFLTNEC